MSHVKVILCHSIFCKNDRIHDRKFLLGHGSIGHVFLNYLGNFLTMYNIWVSLEMVISSFGYSCFKKALDLHYSNCLIHEFGEIEHL